MGIFKEFVVLLYIYVIRNDLMLFLECRDILKGEVYIGKIF